jgi:hypothetical protein
VAAEKSFKNFSDPAEAVKLPGIREARLIATQRSLLDGRADWVMERHRQEFFGP